MGAGSSATWATCRAPAAWGSDGQRVVRARGRGTTPGLAQVCPSFVPSVLDQGPRSEKATKVVRAAPAHAERRHAPGSGDPVDVAHPGDAERRTSPSPG